MTPYKVYVFLAIAFILFVGITLASDPPYADFLFEEDGVMETAGIAISGINLILALILGWIGYRKKEVWRFWLMLGLLSFLFIGETLSWGERIFNLKMPKIAGVTFDALHDVLAVSIGMIKKTRDFIMEIGIQDPTSIARIASSTVFFGFLLYFIIRVIIKRRKEITQFFRINLQKVPFRFVFIALILILIALIVDEDNLVHFPHKEVVDEGLELLAVLGFLFSCISGFLGGRWAFANKDTL